MCKICKRFVALNRSYSTITQPIWERRYHRRAWEIQVCSCYNLNLIIFSFFKDIIDNIIYTSGSCHQNSNKWQCSIIVTCLRLYHVTSILHCHWKKFWTLDTDVYLTYIRFGIILTLLETGTLDRCLIGIVQILRFSGFILYPL